MISPTSPAIWDVSLSSWIIQDGNYPDFEIGQTPEFAVEFWLPKGVIVRTSDGEKSANSVRGHLYDTTAEIVFQNAQNHGHQQIYLRGMSCGGPDGFLDTSSLYDSILA